MNKRHFLSKRCQQELLPLVAFEVTASLLAYKDILTASCGCWLPSSNQSDRGYISLSAKSPSNPEGR